MPIPSAKADGTFLVCRAALGDPCYYTRDPDARRTPERDEIYDWLRDLACPRDDLAHNDSLAVRDHVTLTLAAKAQERRQELETLEKEREAASQRRSDEEQLLEHTTATIKSATSGRPW